VVIFQIKNSLAKAFSRKKNSAGKADSGMTADSDSISIQSDISVADSAVEYLPTPAVRTADWFVQCFAESSFLHSRSSLHAMLAHVFMPLPTDRCVVGIMFVSWALFFWVVRP